MKALRRSESSKYMIIMILALILCMFTLESCTTALSEVTLTPKSTDTPSPTSTQEPTSTNTPTATYTPEPTPTLDPLGDPDGDGILSYFEQIRGTDPYLFDSDNDGIPDYDINEMGEYSKIATGIAIIKAPPWEYLINHDSDLNADVHQYHEIIEQNENEIKIRFIIFYVENGTVSGTPLDQLEIIDLEGSNIEASDESREDLQELITSFDVETDFEAMQAFRSWMINNFEISALAQSGVNIINGQRIDGFTLCNSWKGESLFQMRKTATCGSHATLTSYLGNNIGIPTVIVHSIPINNNGANHFTNESYIDQIWIPIDLYWQGVNKRDPNLLKLEVFRDFSQVDFSEWDYYFANEDYAIPNYEEGMSGLYEIVSYEIKGKIH